MKILYLIVLVTTLVTFNGALYAQLTVKCAGKKYSIPKFRQDTIKKDYNETMFEDLHILDPIQNSGYNIELRAYYEAPAPLSGSMVVIKGNSKRMVIEAYCYCYQCYARMPSDYKTAQWKNVTVHYFKRTIAPSDTLLESLIKNKLFSLPDSHTIIDSLKKKSIKVGPSTFLDGYSMKISLKVNHLYRSFYCEPLIAESNKSIKDLQPEKTLSDLFTNLYLQSGLYLMGP